MNARYQSQKAEMEALRQRVSFLETKMGVAMREDGEDDEDDEDDEDSQDGEDGEEEGGECATSGAMESRVSCVKEGIHEPAHDGKEPMDAAVTL